MEAQWPAVDAILLIGDGPGGDAVAREAQQRGKRVFRGRLAPDPKLAQTLLGKRVLAFAGIGRPEKFFETLRACGAAVEVARPFSDHHPYNASDLDTLKREAEAQGLQAVTTEKDAVRIAGLNGSGFWDGLMVLPVRLQLEDEAALRKFILRSINERRLRNA
jgi:tetraacyldisaccharide 4'-kinase